MDGKLKNKEYLLKQIFKWLKLKEENMDRNFCCDFHIDYWASMNSKSEWLSVGMAIYSLLQDNIKLYYPNLKVMIAFYLSSTRQTKIPKTLSKRNFRERTYTPPVIFIYSDKKDEHKIMGENTSFLPEISAKYKLKAYYSEIQEDVVYRTVFMFN